MKTTRSALPSKPRASYEIHFDSATLFEFSAVVNSSFDLKFILSHILLTIMGKIMSVRGIAMLAHEGNDYVVEMTKGFSTDHLGKKLLIKKIPRAAFFLDRINPSRYPWVATLREWGVAVLLPMFVNERPVGLLGFGQLLSKRRAHPQEQTYLRSLANISATAIEKSHMIAQLQHVNRTLDRKIQELNTLFELGKEFNAVLEQEKVVRLLIFSLLGQIGVSRYLVCLKEGPDIRVAASRIDGQIPHSELLRPLLGIRKPVSMSDLGGKNSRQASEVLQQLGLSVLIPMYLQQESKGMLLLGEKMSREKFTKEECEFLSALANLAIISLENARLFKEGIEKQKLEDELLIAREIQKGLLPGALPSIPHIDIAATNVSSRQVGGDYYDVIPVPDGRFVIAIGDVSGKGPPAALLMATLQATIRALVPLQLPLGELTSRVNNLMCQNTGSTRFVTFFWAFLDSSRMTLSYVNAGHNYPFLVHRDGSVERLEQGGMILGVMHGIPYEEAVIPLRTGDTLVLFTDGVSEAMNGQSEEYGEARLEALVRRSLLVSAQAVIDAMQADIQRHTEGAQQSDDITVMVIRVS